MTDADRLSHTAPALLTGTNNCHSFIYTSRKKTISRLHQHRRAITPLIFVSQPFDQILRRFRHATAANAKTVASAAPVIPQPGTSQTFSTHFSAPPAKTDTAGKTVCPAPCRIAAAVSAIEAKR